MYAVTSHEPVPGGARGLVTPDLSAAFDHMVAENRRTGLTMELRSVYTGALLRSRGQVAAAPLPEIKLTAAMTRALFSDENPLVGLPGASNTLRALETRGLVKRDNVGVARLTSLGRRYRAQKKGA